MKIEKMEMIGFKSFADKTVFSFQPGITAIVGPNGCGKSNIVDALRWVLGEQSPKNMRGERMEDVIFNGSDARKATGMAEVTLFLKDINGMLPPHISQFDEISVTRRLYRSGESEYLINKVPCRLKDIRGLFLDTGLEARSYSIIEQGKIGEILNSKPSERRFLIEEAAGVMRYKAKRLEATQKLELASQNLLRISDIIAELKRQINSLQRQARKAERYRKIREELKDLEIMLARKELRVLTRELSDVSQALERVQEKVAAVKAVISKTEVQIEDKRISLIEGEKEIDAIQETLLETEKRIGEKERRVSLLKNEIASMSEREERIKEEFEGLTIEENLLKGQIKGIEEEGNALGKEIERKTEELSRKEDDVTSVEAEISLSEESIEEAKRSLFEKVAMISDLKNSISHTKSLKDELLRKRDIGETEIKKVEAEIINKEEGLRNALESLNGFKRGIESLKVEWEKTTEGIRVKEKILREVSEMVQEKREILTEKIARLNSLKEIEEGFEGYQEGIRTILKEKRADLSVHGLVADILETPDQYETAIEAVLGERLKHIVIQNHTDILKAIDHLKRENTGRGTFIPLEPRTHDASPLSLNHPGVIGEAMGVVRCKDGYSQVINALLGDVIIVKDLSHAMDLWMSHPIEKTLVTLEGDVINPCGAVTGGSLGQGILRKRREIKKLEEEVMRLKGEVSYNEGERHHLIKDLEDLRVEDQAFKIKIDEIEKRYLNMEKDITILKEGRDRDLKKIEVLKMEADAIEKEGLNLDKELSRLGGLLELRYKEKERVEEEIKSLREVLNTKRGLLEDLKDEVIGLKLDIATQKEKKDGFNKEKNRIKTNQERCEDRIRTLRRELEGIKERTLEAKEGIKNLEDSLASILKERVETEHHLVKIKETQAALYEEVDKLEEVIKEDREALNLLQDEEGDLEVRGAELNVRIEHLIESLRNNYNISIDTSEMMDIEIDRIEAEQRVASFKETLEALGPVNLGAVEEYRDLKERYDFLTGQQTDLLQSIDSLKEAISRIDNTTDKRLRETFDLLNQKFDEVFKIIFGGGRAGLILDGGDILESGIEIVAQLPGKRLQNLSLLSGGEKALVAITLIFASLLVKPSPLCLLDEVDAPLDDINIDRFTEMLKGLSERSQFIIITHNKRTMEVASILYGIAMEESGLSKVVSVRLDGDREPERA